MKIGKVEKNCPLCGSSSSVVIDENALHGYFVQCDNTECQCRAKTEITPERAITVWDKRSVVKHAGYYISNTIRDELEEAKASIERILDLSE